MTTRGNPIILAGPTAAGKSAIALELAQALDGEIVCGDAYQIYEGISLITAAPSDEDMDAVPHHLYGVMPLDAWSDAATYARMCVPVLEEILQRGKTPIVVGGSGLYLDALAWGLNSLPDVAPELREEVGAISHAQQLLKLLELDPLAYEKIDRANRRRVSRALEVTLAAGRPFSDFRSDWNPGAPRATPLHGWRMPFFVVQRDPLELHERIERRVEWMFANGAVEEVIAAGHAGATALKAIGLRQIRDHLNGVITLDEAMEYTQRATRHYAKRQRTWFRNHSHDLALEVNEGSAERILVWLRDGAQE